MTTADGRTGSTSQVVHVETHDVAVVKIEVPKSARVGKTIRVDVRVRNTRYPETVQVDLFKSVPGGFEQFGSLTQSVPVRPRNQTTLVCVHLHHHRGRSEHRQGQLQGGGHHQRPPRRVSP